MPTPFVEGCLRNESVSVTIATSCARTGRKLTIDVDSLGDWSLREPGAEPLLYEPDVDWEQFSKPHIIDDF